MTTVTDDQSESLIGQTIDGGRYIIDRVIGRGGMGQVYGARQTSMDRQVAIKILHRHLTTSEDLQSRFETEAVSVSRLNHPNIITIYDYGKTDDGMLFMVMELLEGITLEDALRRHGRISADRAMELMIQVASAVGEAHRCGVVHRDLKPENIFLHNVPGQLELPKVLDFGIAKIIQGDAGPLGKGTNTAAGTVFGTPYYMSPEQVHGDTIDHRTDVYSAGVILWELITGFTPFHQESPVGAMLSQISEPIPPLNSVIADDEIPAGLQELIDEATNKDRALRIASMAEFFQRLDGLRPTSGEARHESLSGSISPVTTRSSHTYPRSSAPNSAISKMSDENHPREDDDIQTLPPSKDASDLLFARDSAYAETDSPKAFLPEPSSIIDRDSAKATIREESLPSAPLPPVQSTENKPKVVVEPTEPKGKINRSREFDPDQGLDDWTPATRTKNFLWISVLVAMVAVGAFFYVRMVQKKTDDGFVRVPGMGQTSAQIRYTVQSIPTGAVVYNKDRRVGRTPMTASFSVGQSIVILLKKPGYAPESFKLPGKGPSAQTITVKLQKR